MPNTVRSDPLRNFKFLVEIPKPLGLGSRSNMLQRAGFMAVAGIGVQIDAIPYREGGMNTTMRKLPGQAQFADVRLSRGLFDASADGGGNGSWEWFKELFYYLQGLGNADVGNNFRTDITIRVLDHPVTRGGPTNPRDNVPRGITRVAFKLYNAWPTQLTFSDLDAGGNQVMVEQMSLAYEGFDVKHAPSATEGLSDNPFPS